MAFEIQGSSRVVSNAAEKAAVKNAVSIILKK